MSDEILLIDDSKAIHALVRTRLADEPFTIASAYDGVEGLAAAQKSLPSLILLDVDMPGMDGLEVCRRLKADESTCNIPVIFLAGAVSPDDRIYAPEVGAADFIIKPFNSAELRARIRGVMRTRHFAELLDGKAQIDAVTGLWNRAFFDDRFCQELSLSRRSGRPLACILVDIDHFASINETFGRSFGDEVICRVGASLGDAMRMEDIICRYGPDEFAILCPNTESAGAQALVLRCQQAVSGLNLLCEKRPAHVTCSFGVAEDDGAKTSMIGQAEKAVQFAKLAGGNRMGGEAIPSRLIESLQI